MVTLNHINALDYLKLPVERRAEFRASLTPEQRKQLAQLLKNVWQGAQVAYEVLRREIT